MREEIKDRTKSNKVVGIWVLTVAALMLTICATAFRFLSLIFSYDAELQYYSQGALPVFFYIICGISVLAFAVCVFLLFPKYGTDNIYTVVPPNSASKLFAPLCAIALCSYIGGYTIDLLNGSVLYMPDSLKALQLPMIILALFSVIFFVLLAVKSKESKIKNATVIFGFFFILWNVLTWLKTYLDLNVPMNSPNKIIFHMAVASVLLFTVSELRVLLGFAKPRLYYFSLFTVILTASVSAIPSITLYIFGILTSRYTSLLEDLVFLGVLAYAVSRAFCLLPPLKNKATADKSTAEINQCNIITDNADESEDSGT